MLYLWRNQLPLCVVHYANTYKLRLSDLVGLKMQVDHFASYQSSKKVKNPPVTDALQEG